MQNSVKEECEFRDTTIDEAEEYWKAKGRCLASGLSCLGSKKTLIRRHELFAFNSENIVTRLEAPDLEKYSETPLEKAANSSWVTERITPATDTFPSFDTIHPWKVVPELSYISKKIATDEIFKAIGALMRPTFCFYNHINQYLSPKLVGIVFLPFNPELVEKAPEALIKQLAASLNLNSRHESKDLQQLLDRQKLLEVVYTVLDSEGLHGVTYCQTKYGICKNPASSLCSNFMCGGCCPTHALKLPCRIHDRHLAFLQYRLKHLYEFEQELDPRITIRLQLSAPIRKIQLYRVFEGHQVRWEKTSVWHNPLHHRIQYVYLTFSSHEEARNAYISQKQKKSDLKFSVAHLLEPLSQVFERLRDAQHRTLLLVESPSKKAKKAVPPKNQVIPELLRLVSQFTGLQESDVRIQATVNPLSYRYSVREFTIEFPDSETRDLFYAQQPYFQYLIAHKLSHLTPFPYVRRDCLLCYRNKECIHELCGDCCSRYSSSPMHSCTQHTPKAAIVFPLESIQNRRIVDMDFATFIRKIPEKTAKFHILIRHLLAEGVYTWYRPIFYFNSSRMIEANKELQEVLDIPGFRQVPTSKSEGKLFTFNGTPVANTLDGKHLVEAMDNKGRSFMEYYYYSSGVFDLTHQYEAGLPEGQVYTLQDLNDENAGHSLRNSFHFFLAGLDPYHKSLKENIVKEIRNKVGRVLLEDIIFVDRESILANMLLMDPSVESNVESYHRIACVKLYNETDAIKLILGEVSLTLPLNNGHIGCPILIPSTELCQFIHSNYDEFLRNSTHSIPPESKNPDKVQQSKNHKRR